MATEFMGKEFLLKNETARHLYHTYAEKLPIIDYHWAWLGGQNPDGSYFGDHYKWRVMRSNGVSEELVTGNADPYERFRAFAAALEMAPGNPMLHWSNLELHKYFGIREALTEANSREIYDKTADMLQHDPNLTVRGIIRQSGVEMIGTTDDPTDSLEWHEKLAQIPDLGFRVCPSFRPDRVVNIQKAGFIDAVNALAACVGKSQLRSVEEDHGVDMFPYRECTMEEADDVFAKAMAGEKLDPEEAEKYQTTVLLALARKYRKENIVMEIHFSVSRNNNQKMFGRLGPDTGFDMIAKSMCYQKLANFWSALDATDELPRTIVFSLDASDLNQLASSIGCFQSDEIPGKMQLGAAWWFLDTRDGMEQQMKALGNLGLLGNFVGMLTDSRSFLSYPRHDYFRRIACNLLGQWVEDGEYPEDEAALKRIVEGICYRNAKRYFGLE